MHEHEVQWWMQLTRIFLAVDEKSGLWLIPGRVGENCTLHTDCTDVIPESACIAEACTCLGETVPSPDRHVCRLPLVGDPCDAPEDCRFIRPSSFCRAGSCDCQYGFHTPRDPYYCVIRRLGDPCSEDVDCSSAVRNSKCAPYKACDCGPGYRRHPNRTYCAWAKDPENIAAVTLGVFAICLLSFVLIVTVPALVYFFVPRPRKTIPKILKPTFWVRDFCQTQKCSFVLWLVL